MPRLGDASENIATGSNYRFTAPSIAALGATEYTLVTVVVDISGSVAGFKSELEKMLQTILDACKKSPRSENLMLRVVTFNSRVSEFHGFRLLASIDASEYANALHPGGYTALFDATHTAIDALETYGANLTSNDFQANGIVFIITDGEDNESAYTPTQIKDLLADLARKETLESIRTVLIGVNDMNSRAYWDRFAQEAKLDQVVAIGEASASKLAKLADFISRSISSQSQALGTGGPSQALNF